MMEGIGAEAASLAGHLKLANLCWIYDNNRITIEGTTSLAFSEDVPARFTGLRLDRHHVADANDLRALAAAFEAFKAETDRPTLIIVDSIIGYGAPHKQGTHAAHGEPLGVDEVAATKRSYGWPEDAHVPRARRGPRALRRTASASAAGGCAGSGRSCSSATRASTPSWPTSSTACSAATLPDGWDADIPSSRPTRRAWPAATPSGKVLNAIAQRVPWLIGGSADLAPSNKSRLTFEGAGDFSADNRAGRNLHFGVREHAAARGLQRPGAVQAARLPGRAS